MKKKFQPILRNSGFLSGLHCFVLSGFQILATTSIPVYNKVAEAFGGVLNMALPADQVGHYNKFQLWFFSLIIVLTGIGQFFWWKRVGKEKLQALYNPLTDCSAYQCSGNCFPGC